MRKSDFWYDLPTELIAQTPAQIRSGSRLLTVESASGELRDMQFVDLPDLLLPGDLLVFNDTRVLPARLLGKKTAAATSKYWSSVCSMTVACWLILEPVNHRRQVASCYWERMWLPRSAGVRVNCLN